MTRKPTLPIDDMLPASGPLGKDVDPRPLYWDRLSGRDIEEVCRRTGARHEQDGVLSVMFLGNPLFCDLQGGRIATADGNEVRDFLVEMVILFYLLGKDSKADSGDPLPTGKLISPLQLPNGHAFFRDPHVVPTAPLQEVFGSAREAFLTAGQRLGGTRFDKGDASFILRVLPQVEMALILYVSDDEFPARVNLLVSETIDQYLPLDGVWGLFNIVVKRLLETCES
jgi:hypothetical protein